MQYENGYKWRKKLTVNPSLVAGSISDYVSLVSMTDPELKTVANGGRVHRNPLLDIRFETPAGIQVKHTIHRHNESTGELIAWIKLNMSTSTTVYMYYGKDIAPTTTDPVNWGSLNASGITVGFGSSNLTASRDTANSDSYNLGELKSWCTYLTDPYGNSLTLDDASGENSGQESGTAKYGYLMYHTAATAGRFSPTAGTRANFKLVTYEGGQWKYDTNSAYANFTPATGDLLVARIKWGGAAGFEVFQPLRAGEEDNTWVWNYNQYAAMIPLETTPDALGTTLEQPDVGWYSNSGSSGGNMGSASLVPGKIGNAISFDGSDDRITFNDNFRIAQRDDLTLSLWVYPRSVSTRVNLIAKAYGGEYELTLESNRTLSFYWGTTGANSGSPESTYQSLQNPTGNPLPLNQWSHVKISRKLGTGGWLRMYVNGVLEVSKVPLFSQAARSTLPMTLGYGRIGATLDGIIDEVAVMSVAEDEATIVTKYNNENSPSSFWSVGPAESLLTKPSDILVGSSMSSVGTIVQNTAIPTQSVTMSTTSDTVDIFQILSSQIYGIGGGWGSVASYGSDAYGSVSRRALDDSELELESIYHSIIEDSVSLQQSEVLRGISNVVHSTVNKSINIAQNKILSLSNLNHSIIISSPRIINLTELGWQFGRYKDGYGQSGQLEQIDDDSVGRYREQYKQNGIL